MRFRKFTIQGYRAIDLAEVPVSNNIIPIIGINESGKTSILEAILAFDRYSDRRNQGRHLDFKNRYVTGVQECVIAAEVGLDSDEDLNDLSDALKLSLGNPLLRSLQRIKEEGESLLISRTLNTGKYTIRGLDLEGRRNEKVANAVYAHLPFLLYFDDFTDRVPDLIEFLKPGVEQVGRPPKQTEWHQIIEEVFQRGTEGEHTLEDFLSMSNKADRQGLLNDIGDVLNDEIMREWRELRRWGGNLADDPEKLELELGFEEGASSRSAFSFKVNDRARGRKRVFNVTERSKGFQWFFNFLMKLKFNPKYIQDLSGAIYLLDEPGSYLHSSAQEELLKELNKISETNTILYCTHSQHFLNPDIINIGQIKIVTKEEGRISIIPFGSAGSTKYQGAMTPLFDALHLRSGIFNREVNRAVVTEGISDFYFFKLLFRHSKKFAFEDLDLIAGAGAGALRELISFCIAWTEDYLVLLDSDEEGLTARKRYEKIFGAKEGNHMWGYATPSRPEQVRLEDFLSTLDKNRLLGMTGATDLKHALAELYYAPVDMQRKFIRGLDTDTKDNLELVRKRLAALADQ